eukprot:gene8940-9863_t
MSAPSTPHSHHGQSSVHSIHRQASSSSLNSSIRVRLAKLSAAQPLLSANKTHQKMLHRLALIIQESAATPNESTKGKLPVEAAYVVMKKITESAGAPIIPVGLSTFNKLESLRTDPAVTVLKSHSWKEFFTSQQNISTASSGTTNGQSGNGQGQGQSDNGNTNGVGVHTPARPHSAQPKLSSSHTLVHGTPTTTANATITSSPSSASHHEGNAQDGPTLIDVILDTLIGRVENLWIELKISERERKFYRRSLCKFPSQSLEQCQELALYVDALESHKVATKHVLLAIKAREKAVKRCYDVLLALNRKYTKIIALHRDRQLVGYTSNGNSNGNGNGMGIAGLTINTQPSMTSGRNMMNNDASTSTPMLSRAMQLENIPIGSGIQAFWKEELIMALDEVRCASLDVIKAIQYWRRNLWRPQPFIYKDQNYLFKMANDMNVLESDIYKRLLALLPLEFIHCIGIIFNQELIEELVRRGLPVYHVDSQQPFSDPTDESTIRVMVNEFVNNIDSSELEAAAKVVLQEESLQKAVFTERQSLQSKGVFIPLVRLKFNRLQNENNDENGDDMLDVYEDSNYP